MLDSIQSSPPRPDLFGPRQQLTSPERDQITSAVSSILKPGNEIPITELINTFIVQPQDPSLGETLQRLTPYNTRTLIHDLGGSSSGAAGDDEPGGNGTPANQVLSKEEFIQHRVIPLLNSMRDNPPPLKSFIGTTLLGAIERALATGIIDKSLHDEIGDPVFAEMLGITLEEARQTRFEFEKTIS